jgi:hypothetical protein
VVACGVVFAGLLTGLDCDCWLDWDWFDEVDCRLDVESSLSRSPSSERDVCWEVPVSAAVPWLDWLLLVWVVRPSPTAAPRALTTLSPARPACRRRLRLMWVMSLTVVPGSVGIL